MIKTSKLAVVALICGVISIIGAAIMVFNSDARLIIITPLALVGLVLGLVALSKIKKGLVKGKKFTVTGIILNGVYFLVLVGFVLFNIYPNLFYSDQKERTVTTTESVENYTTVLGGQYGFYKCTPAIQARVTRTILPRDMEVNPPLQPTVEPLNPDDVTKYCTFTKANPPL